MTDSKMERMTLTSDEAAEIMGISKPSMLNYIHMDSFPKFNCGKKYVIPRDAFYRWLNDPDFHWQKRA